jgi:hypothetical protein
MTPFMSGGCYVPPVSDEREVQHDPQVLEGDDDLPRQPAPPTDPYTPEPGPAPGERKAFAAMRWAWLVVLVLVAIVIWAAVR